MRAIISVSDKNGITDFAKGLSQLGFEVFSTGGTQKALEEAEVPVKSVSGLTGFPEILDGRVKRVEHRDRAIGADGALRPELWNFNRFRSCHKLHFAILLLIERLTQQYKYRYWTVEGGNRWASLRVYDL